MVLVNGIEYNNANSSEAWHNNTIDGYMMELTTLILTNLVRSTSKQINYVNITSAQEQLYYADT